MLSKGIETLIFVKILTECELRSAVQGLQLIEIGWSSSKIEDRVMSGYLDQEISESRSDRIQLIPDYWQLSLPDPEWYVNKGKNGTKAAGTW